MHQPDRSQLMKQRALLPEASTGRTGMPAADPQATSLRTLSPESTLANLVSHNSLVNVHTLGQAISTKFQTQPELPGVIVMNGQQMVSMISRRKFFEYISQPYGAEIYLKRPIQVLLNLVKSEPLRLSATCKIEQAARIALSRPIDLVYEPIVVISEDRSVSLLDTRDILLAQNQLFITVNTQLSQQRKRTSHYLNKLQEVEVKNKSYAQELNTKNLEIQNKSQLLETQQIQLEEQRKQIFDYNQQLLKINETLSLEGKKAFRATYNNVNSITQNSKQIVLTGNTLIEELENINEANTLITNVSKQIRHLALQAAIAASRSGRQLTEFSYIAQEIRSLVGKTFEASTQLNRTTARLRERLPELKAAAEVGEATAHSLMEKVQQTEAALGELEELVNQRNIQEEQLNFGTNSRNTIQFKLRLQGARAVRPKRFVIQNS